MIIMTKWLQLRLLLGKVRIVFRIGIQTGRINQLIIIIKKYKVRECCNLLVEAGGLLALYVVPPVAGELLLIEDGAVGAEKRGALVTLASIMANVIRLTARLHIGVHARRGRDIVAAEVGMGHLMVDRIVHARNSGYLVQILLLLMMLRRVFRLRWIEQIAEFL